MPKKQNKGKQRKPKVEPQGVPATSHESSEAHVEDTETNLEAQGDWTTTSNQESTSNESPIQTDQKRFKTDKWRSDNSTKEQDKYLHSSVRYSEGRRSEQYQRNKTNYGRDQKNRSFNDDRYRRDRSSSRRRGNSRWQTPEDPEFVAYKDEFKHHQGKINYEKVSEIVSDLFEMDKEYSLAHCVAEDMNMGSGIAVPFRRMFKRIDELLNQRQKTGGLAILSDEQRFIYYLVTKQFSSGKPTYSTLFSSLKQLKLHVIRHDVKKLAMPRIGCGLDRLQWDNVKFMVEFLFRDVDVEIVVCNLEAVVEDSPQQRHRNCKVVNEKYPIQDIEKGTIIVCFCSEDKSVTEEMKALNKKFNFVHDFTCSRKSMGDVIFFNRNKDYLLCFCIVKKSKTDQIDFKELQKCIYAIQRENKKTEFFYIAFQAIREDQDAIVTYKIINLIRNTMKDVDVYVCWPGDLEQDLLMERSGFSPKSGRKEFNRDVSFKRDDKTSEGVSGRQWNLTPKSTRTRQDSPEDKWDSLSEKKPQNLSQTISKLNPEATDFHYPGDAPKYKKTNESSQEFWRQGSQENESSWSGNHNQKTAERQTPYSIHDTSLPSDEGEFETSFEETTLSSEDSLSVLTEDYDMFEKEEKIIKGNKVKEQLVNGLSRPYSRVCYAREDMILESGIAPGSQIGEKIGKLINLKQGEGGLAILKEGNCFLYVLIIKNPTTIPTLQTIFASIKKLRDHVSRNHIKKLVIPMITAPIESPVDWSRVPLMYEYIFRNNSVEIIMASLDKCDDVSGLKFRNKVNLKHVKTAFHMMKNSVIIFLASEDGFFSEEMVKLNKSCNFREEFTKQKKILGEIITYPPWNNVVLCGCVVRKTQNSDIDFEALQRCMCSVDRIATEMKLQVGIQAVDDKSDETVNYKIVSVLLNCLHNVTINITWQGALQAKMPQNVA